ncbi:MAG: helix-hairpin-helix domain-containing protein [Ardenticatenaceae bacterium]|nr:helix-hairpin-helix domain-containing protein [Ardenticatenaceae bacterium]
MKANGPIFDLHHNELMARCLEEVADLLEAQHANPYRVQAYRSAAVTLRNLDEPAAEILKREGLDGLILLPAIGESIAHSIEQMVLTGKLNLRQRLRGETEPEQILATVPGIGPQLAIRIHEQIGVESLFDLEEAAYDGRLARVEGFGAKRLRAVRESLAGRLHRPRRQPRQKAVPNQPSIADLLDVDREYRQKARAGELPRIAPRRFNPTHEAWLPILHTERGQMHYTALYSNTARAHELNMIHDWVVIYRDDQDGSGQWTVITGRYGDLRGKRFVRGREDECRSHYKFVKDRIAGY